MPSSVDKEDVDKGTAVEGTMISSDTLLQLTDKPGQSSSSSKSSSRSSRSSSTNDSSSNASSSTTGSSSIVTGKKLKKLLKTLNNSQGLTTSVQYETLTSHPDHSRIPVTVTNSLDISSSQNSSAQQANRKSAKEKLSSRALRPLISSLPTQTLPPNPFFSVRNIGGLSQTNLIFLEIPSHLPSPIEADTAFNERYDSISYRIKHDGIDVKMSALRSKPSFSVDGDNSEVDLTSLKLSADEFSENLYPSPATHPTFTSFPPPSSPTAPPQIYAIDCEMVQTTSSNVSTPSLARCTITTPSGSQIYDRYILPQNPITDYLTLYSGISPETYTSNPHINLETFQTEVKKLISSEDIIVGHSLENDLMAMEMCHDNVVDTAVLFKDEEDGRKHSLKYLLKGFFNKDIQRGSHDSGEDARAAMDMALLKSKYKEKVGMKGGRVKTEMEEWVFDRKEMVGVWGGECTRFLKGSCWSSGVGGKERVTVGGGGWEDVKDFLEEKASHRSVSAVLTDRSRKYREMTDGRNVRRRGQGISAWKDEDEQEWKREKERARMGEVYFIARKGGDAEAQKRPAKKQKTT
ncbi:hypothetical protein TrST_g5255 [Triparma strigata]|uniref:Exonuclease domain-containing protein n=1 Tax=Triparma strigata TaxID=1606541 RepID=A0A9W6ZXE2_9STRA|nr:hypothetical protein TrST_g5255 [Triparma strigata]